MRPRQPQRRRHDAVAEQRQADVGRRGAVRHLGASNYSPQRLTEALELSRAQLGLLTSAIWGGMLLGMLPFGLLIDRRGERAVVALGALGLAAFLLLAAQASSFLPLFLLLIPAAVGASCAGPGGTRAITAWFPRHQRGMALLGVFGRNDGDRETLSAYAARGMGTEIYESPHSFEVGGKRVLLVHEIAEVSPRSIESHDFVIHGSSHLQSQKKMGTTLVINPGEACGWIHGKCTAAILDTDTGEVENITL